MDGNISLKKLRLTLLLKFIHSILSPPHPLHRQLVVGASSVPVLAHVVPIGRPHGRLPQLDVRGGEERGHLSYQELIDVSI